MSKKALFKISEEGKSIQRAAHKHLLVSSQFDTLKPAIHITATISLPEDVFDPGDSRIRGANTVHGLGYVAFINPPLWEIYNPDPTGAGDWNIVDNRDYLPNNASVYGIEPDMDVEIARVSSIKNRVKLDIFRQADVTGGGTTFPAKTVTADVVVFYNQINATFDLL